MSNEHKVTSNGQKVTSNEQRVKSNEQRATSNKQKGQPHFLRHAQVKNQKPVKMFAYKYEKHKILPTFSEKIKLQW